jgi:hypothetical protein
MPFSARDALDYLVARGLVDRAALLERDPVVIDASRRNRNLKIRMGDGQGFFLKQLASDDPRSVASFRREAEVFRLVRTDAAFRVVGEVSPTCVGYDAHRQVLVFELESAEPTWPRAVGEGADPEVGAGLGRALGRVHRDAARGWERKPDGNPFPGALPWVLSLHETPVSADPAALGPGTSPAMLELIRLLQATPELCWLLGAARERWETDGFVHGDLKWDNILLPDHGKLRIADWELADLGDTAWDVGGVLQGYWNQPLLAGETLHPAARQGWQGRLLRSASAFWKGYARERGLEADQGVRFLDRAVRLGAARSVLTAYEYLHMSPTLTPQSWRLLREGVGVFREPGPTVDALARAA